MISWVVHLEIPDALQCITLQYRHSGPVFAQKWSRSDRAGQSDAPMPSSSFPYRAVMICNESLFCFVSFTYRVTNNVGTEQFRHPQHCNVVPFANPGRSKGKRTGQLFVAICWDVKNCMAPLVWVIQIGTAVKCRTVDQGPRPQVIPLTNHIGSCC